jgi:chromosome segregation ATPase
MASKDELQNALKAEHGINKNISQALSKDECTRLLILLSSEPSVARLTESFVEKNSNLGKNNAFFGRMRSQAESRLETLQTEYSTLAEAIKAIEASKLTLEDRKKQLEQDKAKLEAEVTMLSAETTTLESKVKTLNSENTELLGANEQLKKDNKDLKNLVDAIRLRLAKDTKQLLKYEDSEIRKALIKLFQWTLG